MQADEAGDEDGVVEVDGAAEAGGGVDPGVVLLERVGGYDRWFGLHCGSMLHVGLFVMFWCYGRGRPRDDLHVKMHVLWT